MRTPPLPVQSILDAWTLPLHILLFHIFTSLTCWDCFSSISLSHDQLQWPTLLILLHHRILPLHALFTSFSHEAARIPKRKPISSSPTFLPLPFLLIFTLTVESVLASYLSLSNSVWYTFGKLIFAGCRTKSYTCKLNSKECLHHMHRVTVLLERMGWNKHEKKNKWVQEVSFLSWLVKIFNVDTQVFLYMKHLDQLPCITYMLASEWGQHNAFSIMTGWTSCGQIKCAI